jgi:Protein of unknown function (DUF1579)
METTTKPQESKMIAEPQSQHHWLQKLVGEWNYETEILGGTHSSPEKATGTETVRSLGDFWVLAEGQGEMPGCGAMTTVVTLGYNPRKQKFVGTWVGTMMPELWISEGELDADEKVLTLNSEGPAMTEDGTLANYRDIMEIKDNDHRVMTSHVLGNDGVWNHFMTVNYLRK